MNRSLGRIFHSGPVIGSMSTAHAAAQATSEYQSTRLRLPQLRAAHAAAKVSRISATAIQEIDAVESIMIRISGVDKQKVILRTRADGDSLRNVDPLLFVDRRQQIKSGERRAREPSRLVPASKTRGERRCQAITTISNASE